MANTRIILERVGASVIKETEPTLNTPFASGAVVSNIQGENCVLLVKFDAIPAQYKYAKLISAWIGGGATTNVGLNLCVAEAEDTDIQGVTWAAKPSINNSLIGAKYISRYSNNYFNSTYIFPYGVWPNPNSVIPVKYNESESSQAARSILQAPVIAITAMGTVSVESGDIVYLEGTTNPDSPAGPTPFKLYVNVDPSVTITSQVAAKNGTPKSGYLDPRIAQTFEWDFVSADSVYTCAAKWQQASATFYWRNSNSGAYTAVPMGTANSYTIPANTLSIGVFEWYVEATDETGTTTQSSIYTLSTADALFTAVPQKPINVVEDGSAPIRFLWEEYNDTGTTPNGAELQWSVNLSNWSNLGSVSGATTLFESTPDLFTAGTVYWRVRAYNRDGVAGNWSQPVSFIVIAAPPMPVVSALQVPFSTVSWQSEGQMAWRVTVDNTIYGPYFGKERAFELPDYLRDGTHTIKVEVLGEFNLWSKPGQTTVQIQNVPGDPVTLSGNFDRDAELSWETASQTADFLIYRDGMRIGHTSGMEFADRTVLGGHSWQVVNRQPSGNYTASNTVYGTLCTEELAIALLSGGEWLELTKSRNPTRQETYSLGQTVSLTHFAGQEYPEAETSPYKTLQGDFDVSWTRNEPEQAAAFEAMIGKPIIYKAPSGETLVGILTAIQKNPINFFKAYTATVQRINWRNFVDEDN